MKYYLCLFNIGQIPTEENMVIHKWGRWLIIVLMNVHNNILYSLYSLRIAGASKPRDQYSYIYFSVTRCCGITKICWNLETVSSSLVTSQWLTLLLKDYCWCMLKGPVLIFSVLHLLVLFCNCWSYYVNTSFVVQTISLGHRPNH